MKKYLIFAASALVLASCSSDNFLGENPGNVQNATTAINFGGDAGKITRATSNEGDDHVKLGKEFKVYGVKTTDGTMFHKVFVNYSVWYDETLTTSNTNKWEYVGKNNQTIKYWDYSAKEYRFVAGSPISAFNYNIDINNKIISAEISGLAGHIYANESGTALEANPVYVAEPKIVKKEEYKNTVQFNFIRQQSMVRVGLYETIPGYKITDIKFYDYDTDGTTLKVSDGNNVILTSAKKDYFVGGSNITGTITYTGWDTATPSYTFKYGDTDLTKKKNWYAGKLGNGVEATTSSETDVAKLYGTDKDMATATGYFTVLPTPEETTASAILIKCDYTLTSDDNSGETIKVTGATAAIPAAFSKWEANTRYTYLFKISDNTNGTTGTPGSTDPAGLYPITFDAVVKDVEQGTTTTVATPSITTYQEGSVTDKGIEYKPDKEIKVTVTNADGTEQTLTAGGTTVGSVAVYKFDSAINEAELQVKGTTGATAITENVNVAGNVFTFTPDAVGFYAIKYLTEEATTTDPNKPAVYTYKVVEVK